MANVNIAILIGRLTRDPELRYTQGGTAVTEFGFAVNRKWKSADGRDQEETMFINIVAWARTAEVICQYLKKGSSAYIQGRLTLDQWEDRETNKKRQQHKITADFVQFLDGGSGQERSAGQRSDAGQRGGGGRPAPAPAPSSGGDVDFDLDEDVPF